jgi:alpha-glucosidase
MENVAVPEDRLQDPARFYGNGRDGERTPMHWTPAGGFTSGEPWLPYGDLSVNVEAQSADPESMLSFYRRLIWFRRGSDALQFGSNTTVGGVPEEVFAFVREHGGDRLLVVLNFSGGEVAMHLPDDLQLSGFVMGTHGDRDESLVLASHEGRLYQLA